MDILIKGIDLPKKGDVLKLYLCSDGDVGYQDEEGLHKAKAIALPPHGKLCDKDAVWDMLHGICVKCNENKDNEKYTSCIWCKIKDAYSAVYGSIPTILEVSR